MPRSLEDNNQEEEKSKTGFTTDVATALKKRGADLASSVKKGMQGGAGFSAGLQTLGAIGGAVTDVGSEIVSHGYEAIGAPGKETAKVVGKAVINATPDPIKALGMSALKAGVETWTSFKAAHPEAAKDIEAVGNIAGAIPTVKGAVGLGKGVIKGAVGASKAAGRTSASLGESIFTTVLPMNDVEAKAMQSFLAKNSLTSRVKDVVTGQMKDKPITQARQALQAGFAGTESMLGVQANRVANGIRDIIFPILEKTKATVSKTRLLADMAQEIEDTVEEGAKSRMKQAFEKIAKEYSNWEEYINIKKAQTLKSEINTKTPATFFSKGKDLSNEYKALKQVMANSIKRQTYENLGPEIKDTYLTWSKMMDLMELGIKDSTGRKTIFGANFWGRLMDKTVTPIATSGGQMLYTLGNMMQFKGRPGIKKFGDFVKDTFGEGQLLLEDIGAKIKRGAVIELQPTKNIIQQTKQLSQQEAADYLRSMGMNMKYQDSFIPQSVKDSMILNLKNRKETTAADLNKLIKEMAQHDEMIKKQKEGMTTILKGKYPNALDLRTPKP